MISSSKLPILFALLATAVVLAGCVEPTVCGNGVCEAGEMQLTCPEDCGGPPTETHLECQAQQCVEVLGAGIDGCATDGDCAGGIAGSFSIDRVIGLAGSEFIVSFKGSDDGSGTAGTNFMSVKDSQGAVVLEQALGPAQTIFSTLGFSEEKYKIEFFAGSPQGQMFEQTLGFEIVGENEECVVLEGNTPRDSAINLVFVGTFNEDISEYNYGSAQEFRQVVTDAVEDFFAVEPYRSYRPLFNVEMVINDVNLGCVKPETGMTNLLKAGCDQYRTMDLAYAVCGAGDNVVFPKSVEGASYAEVQNNLYGFDNSLIFLSEPMALAHEFGHAFAVLDDEYVFGSWDIHGELQHRNCDTILNNVACPLWCNGPTKTIDEFLSIDCTQFSLDSCGNYPQCLPIPSEGCVNALECTTKTTQAECENFTSKDLCKWLTPENSGFENVPPKFYNSFCVPKNVPSIDIGTDCLEGTGCYAGCWIQNSFRSVPTGLMSLNFQGEFGPFNEGLVCEKLIQKTGQTIGVCA